jgi:hypothetical protein
MAVSLHGEYERLVAKLSTAQRDALTRPGAARGCGVGHAGHGHGRKPLI